MQPMSVRPLFHVVLLLRTVSFLRCVTGAASALVFRVAVYLAHTLRELVDSVLSETTLHLTLNCIVVYSAR